MYVQEYFTATLGVLSLILNFVPMVTVDWIEVATNGTSFPDFMYSCHQENTSLHLTNKDKGALCGMLHVEILSLCVNALGLVLLTASLVVRHKTSHADNPDPEGQSGKKRVTRRNYATILSDCKGDNLPTDGFGQAVPVRCLCDSVLCDSVARQPRRRARSPPSLLPFSVGSYLLAGIFNFIGGRLAVSIKTIPRSDSLAYLLGGAAVLCLATGGWICCQICSARNQSNDRIRLIPSPSTAPHSYRAALGLSYLIRHPEKLCKSNVTSQKITGSHQ